MFILLRTDIFHFDNGIDGRLQALCTGKGVDLDLDGDFVPDHPFLCLIELLVG